MESQDIRLERFRQLKKEIRGSAAYLIVGIDIGKSSHHAFLGTATGRGLLRRLKIENSAEGFERLVAHVGFCMTKEGLSRVVFGLEPTSVYHKPLAEFLIRCGYLVVYVTNEAIKKNRALLDGRWDKNDTKDAANAADLVSQGRCQYYDLPDMTLRDLRSLLAVRTALKKQHHRLRMRIRNNLVAQYFPEFDKLWSKSQAENLAIVRWCLAPEEIAQMEFEKFFQVVTTRNRGNGQYRRLRTIWETAHDSIGCRAGLALKLEAKIMVEALHQVNEHIAEADRSIKELCSGFVEYKLLLTIPGFGPYIAAVVLAAIGNADRFENQSQLIRLAGLDLCAQRSGDKSATAVPVISKKGKAHLRYALYQAGLIASTSNTRFMAYFTKLLRGREREKGIRTKMRVKLAAKLLVIAWTLMKKKEPFDPGCLNIE